jgi:AsmA-like protein
MVAQNSSPAGSRLGKRGWILVFGATLAVLISGAFIYLELHWPFTRSEVAKSLEDASSSKVEFGSFRSSYFPHPGCIAQNVVIYQGSQTDLPPIVTIEKLSVQGSILGMLTNRVTIVRAEGMQIFIPRQSEHAFKSSSDVTIEKLIANDAILKFESHSNGKPLEFRIHEGELNNVGGLGGIHFRVRLTNPKPPGEIDANGTFGPWISGHAGQTKVSGQYSFEHADLGTFEGIAGILSSKGKFEGTLENIGVEGTTNTSDFTVRSSRHKTELRNQFKAVVNGTNGDVTLQSVDGQFRKTTIFGKGGVAPHGEKQQRTGIFDLCSKDGRIQDLFLLFIKDEHSPITGTTNLCAHLTIPSGKQPFLRKVVLVGNFGVDIGNFTKPETQENVNKLSAEAIGGDDDKAGTVLSSLHGHVEIRGGNATFSDLSFGIPGALAQMHGDYDLVSHRIDLHGTLKMDSEPSHMAHGPKALLMKFVDPFFKKKHGSEVPVKITGTYEKPSFGLDLGGKKPDSASKRLQHLYQPRSKPKPMR